MKKLLFLIVVLALTLGTLASCDLIDQIPFLPDSGNEGEGNEGGEGGEGGGNEVVETDIQEAVDQLDDIYEEKNGTSTANDYELVAQMELEGTLFTITWTVDNDNIGLELVDGEWCVDVPEDSEENYTYTLTAHITTAGGQEATVSYTRVIPGGIGMIANPEVGKAYKFALLHGNEKAVVYFDGNNYNNYAWYLSYTTDQLAAVDVYLEAVEGVADAYRLYYDKDGEKTYIVAFPRDGDTAKGTLKLDTVCPEEYYTWDADYNTLVYTSVTGESFYIGSSGTYKSISLSAYSYINGATSYVAHLYGAGGVKEELPEQVLPEVPENYTSADLVDALYKLESGQTLEGPYELTGVITSIKYAYDPAYNNVSVNIVVEGREDKPVLCYRLNGGEELKVGDTITVFAGLTNYGGTYETTSGGVIREVVPGEGTVPEQPEVPSDAKGILDALYALKDGESLSGSFTLTGKITALDNYKNPTIVVEGFENQPVYCYRLVVDNAIGDVITVTATSMKNYGGTYEFMNCTLVENGGDTPSNPDPEQPETPAYTAPVAGQAYDLFMELPTGKVYFAGSMSGDYLATTTDATASVKIYFEAVDGGYHIYFMNGDVKTYITAAAYLKSNGYAGCHFYLTTDTPTLAWTYDTTYGIIEIYDEIEGKSDTFFAGTYGTYNTVSLSGAYYKDQIASGSQYPARLELVEGGNTDTPVDPDPEQPVDPDPEQPEVPSDAKGILDALYALKDGESLSGSFTLTGKITALDNYKNPTIVVEGFENQPVYCYRLVVDNAIGDVITVTATSMKNYGGTYEFMNCTLVENGGDTPVDPDPEQPVDPEQPEVPEDGIYTIPEALAAAVGTNVIVKGQVVEINQVWSEQHGNITVTIADADGNELYVYRMTTNVVAGDFVTITGTVGEYNGAKQIAQGATAEITGHEDLVVDASCKTVSFADVANRTSISDDKQVWEANGVIITNNKAASTQKIADYSAPIRFYAHTDLVIECKGMTKITFNLNSGKPAANFTDSISGMTGFTVEEDGNDITLVFDSAVDSFTIADFVAQVRVDSIDVYVG